MSPRRPFGFKLRGFAKGRGPLRPLRGSGYALGQPDAFGAGASRYHYAFASRNTSTINYLMPRRF